MISTVTLEAAKIGESNALMNHPAITNGGKNSTTSNSCGEDEKRQNGKKKKLVALEDIAKELKHILGDFVVSIKATGHWTRCGGSFLLDLGERAVFYLYLLYPKNPG